MEVLGVDLGGTKLAAAVFSGKGEMLFSESVPLESRSGNEAGRFITGRIEEYMESARGKGLNIKSIGISVPGISRSAAGTVWAPNIKGWDDYPLLGEIKKNGGGHSCYYRQRQGLLNSG